MKLSLICNVDTRPGMFDEDSLVGRFGQGSLQGVRGIDMLTHNIENKLIFFKGIPTELIIVCDIHEPIPAIGLYFWKYLGDKYGVEVRIFATEFNRTMPRWNDKIELFGYHKATGTHICHVDQDVSCFRSESFDLKKRYFDKLDSGLVKFICQPSKLWPYEHKMTHCSTRFAICRRDALDWDEVDLCLNDDYRIARWGNHHVPCLEFLFGLMSHGSVEYPKTENFEDCLVWSWIHYHKNTLEKLNRMTFEEVHAYAMSCGIHGPNDLVGKPL